MTDTSNINHLIKDNQLDTVDKIVLPSVFIPSISNPPTVPDISSVPVRVADSIQKDNSLRGNRKGWSGFTFRYPETKGVWKTCALAYEKKGGYDNLYIISEDSIFKLGQAEKTGVNPEEFNRLAEYLNDLGVDTKNINDVIAGSEKPSKSKQLKRIMSVLVYTIFKLNNTDNQKNKPVADFKTRTLEDDEKIIAYGSDSLKYFIGKGSGSVFAMFIDAIRVTAGIADNQTVKNVPAIAIRTGYYTDKFIEVVNDNFKKIQNPESRNKGEQELQVISEPAKHLAAFLESRAENPDVEGRTKKANEILEINDKGMQKIDGQYKNEAKLSPGEDIEVRYGDAVLRQAEQYRLMIEKLHQENKKLKAEREGTDEIIGNLNKQIADLKKQNIEKQDGFYGFLGAVARYCASEDGEKMLGEIREKIEGGQAGTQGGKISLSGNIEAEVRKFLDDNFDGSNEGIDFEKEAPFLSITLKYENNIKEFCKEPRERREVEFGCNMLNAISGFAEKANSFAEKAKKLQQANEGLKKQIAGLKNDLLGNQGALKTFAEIAAGSEEEIPEEQRRDAIEGKMFELKDLIGRADGNPTEIYIAFCKFFTGKEFGDNEVPSLDEVLSNPRGDFEKLAGFAWLSGDGKKLPSQIEIETFLQSLKNASDLHSELIKRQSEEQVNEVKNGNEDNYESPDPVSPNSDPILSSEPRDTKDPVSVSVVSGKNTPKLRKPLEGPTTLPGTDNAKKELVDISPTDVGAAVGSQSNPSLDPVVIANPNEPAYVKQQTNGAVPEIKASTVDETEYPDVPVHTATRDRVAFDGGENLGLHNAETQTDRFNDNIFDNRQGVAKLPVDHQNDDCRDGRASQDTNSATGNSKSNGVTSNGLDGANPRDGHDVASGNEDPWCSRVGKTKRLDNSQAHSLSQDSGAGAAVDGKNASGEVDKGSVALDSGVMIAHQFFAEEEKQTYPLDEDQNAYNTIVKKLNSRVDEPLDKEAEEALKNAAANTEPKSTVGLYTSVSFDEKGRQVFSPAILGTQEEVAHLFTEIRLKSGKIWRYYADETAEKGGNFYWVDENGNKGKEVDESEYSKFIVLKKAKHLDLELEKSYATHVQDLQNRANETPSQSSAGRM